MNKKAPIFNLKREREVLKLYIFQLLFTSLLACIIHEFNFMWLSEMELYRYSPRAFGNISSTRTDVGFVMPRALRCDALR
jgi:hypothetical protein